MSDPCPVGLRGAVPSLNTPFGADGGVDVLSLRRLVDHVAASGCAGMLALAVAGESAFLAPEEVDLVARTVVEHNAGRLPVILGVTAASRAERLCRARLARDLGADGVLCQPPAGLDRGERFELLAEVAEAGPGLLVLQDLDWHGPGLAVAEIVELFGRLPRFGALKVEVAPAGPKYSAVLAATGGRLHVSGGWAVMQMPDALARGVHAFMGTELEAVYVAIVRLWRAGREEAARGLFEAALPVLAFANQHVDVSIRFLKLLRRANGIFETDVCRPGVRALDAVQRAEAERLLPRAQALIARAEAAAVVVGEGAIDVDHGAGGGGSPDRGA